MSSKPTTSLPKSSSAEAAALLKTSAKESRVDERSRSFSSLPSSSSHGSSSSERKSRSSKSKKSSRSSNASESLSQSASSDATNGAPVVVRVRLADCALLRQLGLGGQSKALAVLPADTVGSLCEKLQRQICKGLAPSQRAAAEPPLAQYRLHCDRRRLCSDPTALAQSLLLSCSSELNCSMNALPLHFLPPSDSSAGGASSNSSSLSRSGGSNASSAHLSQDADSGDGDDHSSKFGRRLSLRVGLKDFTNFTSSILKTSTDLSQSANARDKSPSLKSSASNSRSRTPNATESPEVDISEGYRLFQTLPNVQAFNDALSLREFDEVREMASETPDLCRIEDKSGWSPLHTSVRDGNLELSRLFLMNGASIGSKNRSGTTPLHYVFSCGSEDTTEVIAFLDFLLDHLGYVNFDERNNEGNTCLHYAAESKNGALVPYLLDKGLDPNVTNKLGVTPLVMAIYKKNFAAVSALLDHGADMWIKTKMGDSALQAAKESKSKKMYELIKARYDQKRVTQLRNIVQEIVKTETDYVNYLRLTIDLFRTPLRDTMHLSARTINVLFANIDDVLAGSTLLLADLQQLEKQDPEQYDVGARFLRNLPSIEPHVAYCANQSSAETSLKVALQDPSLIPWFAETHKNPQLKKQDIESYLIKPLQRLCRYPLLLREMRKYTSDEAEQRRLEKAIDAVNEMAARANETKRKVDAEAAVLSAFAPMCEMSSRTRLITQISLSLIMDSSKGLPFPGDLVLLNDRLIIARTLRKGGYRRKNTVIMMLAEEAPILWDMPDKEGGNTLICNAFSIVRQSGEGKIVVICPDSSTKNKLMDQINECSSHFLQPGYQLPVNKLAPITPDELYEKGMKSTVSSKWGLKKMQSFASRLVTPAQKRLKLATFLMNSEKLYLGGLRHLETVAQTALANGVPRRAVDRVLGKVSGLVELTQPLADQLTERVIVDWSAEQLLADLFVRSLPFMQSAYHTYAQHCTVVLEEWPGFVSSSAAVRDQVTTLSKEDADLFTRLLYSPLVRLRTYQVTMNLLLELTIDDHPDHANIKRCVDTFAGIWTTVEPRVQAIERNHPSVGSCTDAVKAVEACTQAPSTSSAVAAAAESAAAASGIQSAAAGSSNPPLQHSSSLLTGSPKGHSRPASAMMARTKSRSTVAEMSADIEQAASNKKQPVRMLHHEVLNASRTALLPWVEEAATEKIDFALLSNELVFAPSKQCKKKTVLGVGQHVPLELVWFVEANKGFDIYVPGLKFKVRSLSSSVRAKWASMMKSSLDAHLSIHATSEASAARLTEESKRFGVHTFSWGGTVSGWWDKGLMEGRCELTFQGNRFSGAFHRGVMHGTGVCVYFTEDVYSGEWKANLPHGHGTFTSQVGDVYEGAFVAGQRCGSGKMVAKDGTCYEGSWKDDLPHGEGTLTHPNGPVYTGQFQSGVFHGTGTLTLPNGDKYVGEFMDGQRHGKGEMVFAQGDYSVYQGSWSHDQMHGQGTLLFRDEKSRYAGAFVHGQRNGSGLFVYADGSRYEGKFKANQRSGKGVQQYANGDVFDGLWKNDQRSGLGTLTLKCGTKYNGTWVSDRKKGAFKVATGSGEQQCTFVNDAAAMNTGSLLSFETAISRVYLQPTML